MLFNSIEFAIFLLVAIVVYWGVLKKHLATQNTFILAASYLFYGWWDWRFLSLIAFSTVVDYFCAIKIQKSDKEKTKKTYLVVSLFTNLGFLGFFKYFNFFAESFAEAFSLIGNPINAFTLEVVLPVGISFYTFQTMSYTIDVYRKKIDATDDFIAFAAFVSFFPQLVAGPIERATNLLPQFFQKRKVGDFELIVGLNKILWGLFKKVVVGDLRQQCF